MRSGRAGCVLANCQRRNWNAWLARAAGGSSVLLVACLLAVAAGCKRSQVERAAAVPAGISWASLLADAGDLRALARPVEHGATARLFSSCLDSNKVMLANLAPQILGDMDHGFFKEVVDGTDGVTATLAEFDGPGVVSWVWSANPVGTLKLYIDGRALPALSMAFDDFLAGRFLPVGEPFASVTSLGRNLHFPIIHATHLKLTLTVPRREDLSELFYQVAWQALPSGATVCPFDAGAIEADAKRLSEVGRQWIAISKSTEVPNALPPTKTTQVTLPAGREVEVFRAVGPKAITALRFRGNSKADLQGLCVEGVWDGDGSVRVPLHMLAGVSSNMEDTQSLPATVDGNQATIRWFMPFAAEGRVLCSNATARLGTFTAEVWTQPIDAADYPLRFHANCRTFQGIPTRGTNILTLAEVAGPGRFVGCVLGVDSRSDQWWGEGDHLIWLDDPGRPALHGTGTEDYFGFAWCSQGIFNHPFRGQTMVGGTLSHRIAHMHRYHILDRLPFQRWGRFQFEAWGLGDGRMDWNTSIMWYGEARNPSAQAGE